MTELKSVREKVKSVSDYSNQNFVPKIEQFEQEFKLDYSDLTTVLKNNASFLAVGFFTMCFPGFIRIFAPYSNYFEIIGLILLGIAAYRIYPVLRIKVKKIKRHMQAKKMMYKWLRENVIKYLSVDFNYDDNPEFPKKIFDSCGLFSTKYESAIAANKYSGVVDKKQFQLMNVKTINYSRRTDGQGKRTTQSICNHNGSLFITDLNREISNYTLVQKSQSQSVVSKIVEGAKKLIGSKLLTVENHGLPSSFKVSSTDPAQARKILNSSIRNYINNLQSIYGDVFEFAFFHKYLVVSITGQPILYPQLSISAKKVTKSVVDFSQYLVNMLEAIEALDTDDEI